jgi:hypothetical protein
VDINNEYTGAKFRVVHCVGALESLKEALAKRKIGEHDGRKRSIIHQIDRLTSGQRLSASTFVTEGDLPNGKKFKALKKQPLRAYLWLSDRVPTTYFISHYIFKDRDKLSANDTHRVCTNWRRIEEQGDEF